MRPHQLYESSFQTLCLVDNGSASILRLHADEPDLVLGFELRDVLLVRRYVKPSQTACFVVWALCRDDRVVGVVADSGDAARLALEVLRAYRSIGRRSQPIWGVALETPRRGGRLDDGCDRADETEEIRGAR
jgi:hypothetical protein